MERLTMWSTWTWKFFPVFLIIISLFIGYSDPEAKYFCLFFLGSAIFTFFFTEAKTWLKLHNIYIDDHNLIIKRSVSLKPKYKVPLDNAINVEYQPFAQQIIGKFWYFDPQSLEKTFVYFWPTKREARWQTSKLHRICVDADYKREDI